MFIGCVCITYGEKERERDRDRARDTELMRVGTSRNRWEQDWELGLESTRFYL